MNGKSTANFGKSSHSEPPYHKRSRCMPGPCPYHNPSDHHMKDWPKSLNSGIRLFPGLVERHCEHGVGHPDPDSVAWYQRMQFGGEEAWSHGCDGCCINARQENLTTQRDQLAAVLHPLFDCWHTEMHYMDDGRHVSAMDEPCKGRADFLIARGVRVVDADTLGKALDAHECVGDWSICNHKCAQSVLDALDGMTE